mmetsp:Transcript_14619/g.47619  ORF Transcript_14619/g.47619 Transcript_14619/m.47619 type:complete len:229 (-) Transcript_14619:995-1681(-)
MKSRLLGPFDGGEAGAAEFLELLEGDGEVPEEGAEVLGVDLGVFAELLVVAEEEVGGKHHELLRGIFVLGRPVPVPELPGDVQEEGVVGVRQEDRRRRPEAVVAGVERIAPAEGVSTGEGDDVLVGEAHAVEDVVAEVLRRLLRRTLVGVGEAAVGGDGIDGLVDAAVRPRHRGPAGLPGLEYSAKQGVLTRPLLQTNRQTERKFPQKIRPPRNSSEINCSEGPTIKK